MTLKLSQQKIELAYSLFLIILIPACMVGSTIWLTGQVKANFDQELRRKANLANEVFGVSVTSILTNTSPQQTPARLQSLIDQTRNVAPEIDSLNVAVQQGSGFQTLASSDSAQAGQADTTIQTQLAWSKNQPIASLIAAGEGQDREWLVATPIIGATGTPLAISTMRVSLRSADELITTTLRTAFIMLSLMLIIIIFLLLNHFRFVEYAELFRKQRELDQMKDDFISIATHELKAPMSVIKGYLSMVLDEKISKNVRDMVRISYEQTERLNHLVTDLLDVSRLEQGRTKYTIKPVNLPAIITPMLESTYKAKAAEKHLGLHYQPPADLPAVAADPDRVSEIFTNLIDNAVKYSRTGSVQVSHTVTPAAVITTVEDTGIGMTPDEQSRLFQRFYRARNDDTKEISGTGLGLWIIKQYIEHMGGTIRVESEKGKGSKFVVALPPATTAPPQTD
jgi:signal transduction histidine kinase